MITLDASVLIAFLRPADQHHPAARELLVARASEGFGLHPLTLAEVLVGAVRLGRADELLADLTDIGVRTVEMPADQSLRLATLRAETGLRLPDCCVLDAALFTMTPLATFDERLFGVAARRGLEVLPAQ